MSISTHKNYFFKKIWVDKLHKTEYNEFNNSRKGGACVDTDVKKDIQLMTETAKFLAEQDPKSFFIIKSNTEILKARHDLEVAEKMKFQTSSV